LHPFWYQFFAFFYGPFSKVIALPTIAIAKRLLLLGQAIQKRSHGPIYKTYTKIEAKRLRATTFANAKRQLNGKQ
jgi:hypothetical protein